MTHCGVIEGKLSAYLDGALPDVEKKLIEEHITHCAHCRITLSELKKTGDLIHKLEKVDPPPWFTQKVMARVREEAAPKKGLFEKLFYPFHIKIPLEVMATCLIAVLAFSFYRTAGPELKALQEPQAPSVNVPQEPARKTYDSGPVAAKKTAPGFTANLDVSSDKQKDRGSVIGPDTKVRSGLQDNAAPPAATSEKPAVEKKEAIKGKWSEQEMRTDGHLNKSDSQARQERAPPPAPLPQEAGSVALSQGAAPAGSAAANKLRSAKEALSTPPLQTDRFSIALHTNNTETAFRETEGILKRFGARHINIISRHDNFIILAADIPGQKIKEFQEALKAIGNTKESGKPSPSPEEYIRISIEITVGQ